MFKFKIDYYFNRYHTGVVMTDRTRSGIVTANNRGEAVEKIRQADNNFISIANVEFEEVADNER